MPTPASSPPVSRRTVLRWSGAALGGVGALAVAGCGAGTDDGAGEVDPLIAQAERARVDAATAGLLVALLPDRAGALNAVGAERTTHAQVLDAEVARLAGADPASTTTASTTTTTTVAPAADPPTLDLLRERLNGSQRAAADLARTLQGYRAGLLASISAACAVHKGVLLP
ncbi:hypothetical protein ACWDT5_02285 [Rhodococcus aetherivorans]|uniref:Probable conserved transmembrane alanine rich protein n=1 Tax=Rhodococcus aetherivorans TaxID=191292 RepID=A0A059MRW5_9NOCA|nr:MULTISPECIES: hypothetical protein [Rhodococcus]KDE13900.1 hypothetical protein N505_0108720 [Rhodococcus aetherivorans]MBC2587237.1 hypothetical protein [Rhodococcus aetherivorans]MDV6291695.1 hypothetical protein [Rhodococcus aetherivorans]NGP28195.1 hypothetical protein [Rhodococcus aetherivorans]QIX50230.1 hypothetical protein HFP48_12180 [Rhodococcus sp. DMU1]